MNILKFDDWVNEMKSNFNSTTDKTTVTDVNGNTLSYHDFDLQTDLEKFGITSGHFFSDSRDFDAKNFGRMKRMNHNPEDYGFTGVFSIFRTGSPMAKTLEEAIEPFLDRSKNYNFLVISFVLNRINDPAGAPPKFLNLYSVYEESEEFKNNNTFANWDLKMVQGKDYSGNLI